MAVTDNYDDWVNHGVEKGWISLPDCIHHGSNNPMPLTPEEEEMWEEGQDPCLVAARFWGPEGKPEGVG